MKMLYTLCIFALILLCGCAPDGATAGSHSRQSNGVCFAPAAVAINRLSEITMIDDYNDYAKIKLFVDVTDEFGDNMKAPGEFRFELYEHRGLSVNNIGSRIYDWPAVDISNIDINQSCWQDSLRTYMFNLNIDRKLNKGSKYVVSVTFINDAGHLRFSNTRTIEYYGK